MIPSTSSHPPSKVIPARTATGISYPSRASPSIPSSPGLQYHRQRRIGRANISSTPLSPSVTRPTISSTGKQRSIRRSASSTSLVSLSSALRQTVPPRSPVTRRHKTKEITPSRPIPDMSVLYRQLAAALVAEIKVNFEQDGIVDLIGGANTGSSYSLPGQIILSLPNLPAGHEGRLREVRDLQIVIEGKSEFFDTAGRYTPIRLFTSTIILATPDKPLLIPSSNPLQSHSLRIAVAVDFDLRLPGWLPPSHISGLTKTEYGVVVKSSIGWTEAAASLYGAPNISGRSIAFRSLGRPAALLAQLSHLVEKNISAYHPFVVKRHRLPSAMNPRAIDGIERNFALHPGPDSTSPVECTVTVPDWVDCFGKERDFKVNIRLRARRGAIEDAVKKHKALTTPELNGEVPAPTSSPTDAVPGSAAAELKESHPAADKDTEILTHILELAMEVEELESYTSVPVTGFTSVYPIPDASQQPERHSSHNAFISPRSPHADTECTVSDDVFRGHRTRKCLLADDGTQRNFRFDNDGLPMGERWRKVNVVIPMPRDGRGGKFRPQSDMEGPMVRIKHVLKIRVTCKNVGTTENTVVVLTTPIRFGTSPATEEIIRAGSRSLRESVLPAYIQAFHENGEQRQCDPLPLYTKTAYSDPPPLYYTIAHSIGSTYPLACTSRSSTPIVGPPSRSLTLPQRPRWSRATSSSSSTPTPSSDDESDFGPGSSDDGHGSIGSNHSTDTAASSLFPPAIPAFAITKLPPMPVAAA